MQTEGPEQNKASSQTEEFDYMFRPAGYQAPDQEYFDSDVKVRFYTGLPSYEVLMVVFEHVSSHVSRKTQNLSHFQEFVKVLIKLRLNVPLQDLAYTALWCLLQQFQGFSHSGWLSWMLG